MKTNKPFKIFSVLSLLLLSSCTPSSVKEDNKICVMIENNPLVSLQSSVYYINKGEDLSFDFTISSHCELKNINYEQKKIRLINYSDEVKSFNLTLFSVSYSVFLKIETSYYSDQITYNLNGGHEQYVPESQTFIQNIDRIHLRANTLTGTNIFKKDNSTLIGWNTKKGETGEEISLGGKVYSPSSISLFAEWRNNSPASSFSYIKNEKEITLTSYSSLDKSIVIPSSIEGIKVTSISKNCFTNLDINELVIPSSVVKIEDEAFTSCNINKLYLFDNLKEVDDAAFVNTPIEKIRINAYSAPTFSGTYFDTFNDKLDRLALLQNNKKIVLSGGSSWRFGVNSQLINDKFPSYDIINMGVYAYSNMLPQYEMIYNYMNEGDVLLISPEFDAIAQQFCTSNKLDYYFFAMNEGNYNSVSLLNPNKYSNFFSSFREYNNIRSISTPKNYACYSYTYDENNEFKNTRTYNDYGDYTYYRPNNAEEKLFGIKRASYNKYDFSKSYLDSFNKVIDKFLNKGIKVYFTYSPRSEKSITKNSTKNAIDELDIYLRNNLNSPIISPIADSLINAFYFYNTDNHLSTDGVEKRTKNLINDLEKVLI